MRGSIGPITDGRKAITKVLPNFVTLRSQSRHFRSSPRAGRRRPACRTCGAGFVLSAAQRLSFDRLRVRFVTREAMPGERLSTARCSGESEIAAASGRRPPERRRGTPAQQPARTPALRWLSAAATQRHAGYAASSSSAGARTGYANQRCGRAAFDSGTEAVGFRQYCRNFRHDWPAFRQHCRNFRYDCPTFSPVLPKPSARLASFSPVLPKTSARLPNFSPALPKLSARLPNFSPALPKPFGTTGQRFASTAENFGTTASFGSIACVAAGRLRNSRRERRRSAGLRRRRRSGTSVAQDTQLLLRQQARRRAMPTSASRRAR
jgi:hypothetical protein